MLPTTRRIPFVLFLAASALVVGSSAATAAASQISDPVGDVQDPHMATVPQQNTVDIISVKYAVRDDQLIITTRVVDLAHTPGNQFMDTEVGTGGSSFDVSSEVGMKRVEIFTGTTLFKCKGSSSMARFGQDLVRQVVPISCLDDAVVVFGQDQVDQVRLKSSSLLTRANGSPIARDGAKRSGTIELAAQDS